MTPTKGEMYTVTPHKMHDGSMCGTWHCRIKGEGINGRVTAQQMKIVDGRWKPSMSTTVDIGALRPLEVQVDLFGDPAGGAR